MENFLFPVEIVLKIFGYLGLGELIQCSKVSKRFNTICKDKSLGYRLSMLIMKDLGVRDQKYINEILIARPELTKVVIHSISWEEGDETRLSGAMAERKFLGPKRYCMEKKKEVLKELGTLVRVRYFRILTSRNTMIFGPLASWTKATYPTFARRRPLEIGLFCFMPTSNLEHINPERLTPSAFRLLNS